MKPSQEKSVTRIKSSAYEASRPTSGETWVTVSLRMAKRTAWAPAGHEIASKDFCVHPCSTPIFPSVRGLQHPLIKETARTLDIKTSSCQIGFDLLEARLNVWNFRGKDVICSGSGPRLTFWRAPTDNDNGGAGQADDWRGHRLHQMTEEVRSVHHTINSSTGALEILVESYIAPPVLGWGFKTKMKYVIHSDGKILLSVSTATRGSSPGTLPRVGLEMSVPKEHTHCEWFGLGPGQTYRDMKSAGKIGIWKKPLSEMAHVYEMPQETGNHAYTRWAKVTDEAGTGLKAVLRHDERPFDAAGSDHDSTHTHKSNQSSLDKWEHVDPELGSSTQQEQAQEILNGRPTGGTGFDFAVSKYTALELDRAQHPHELRESEGVNLRIDAAHYGLGSASCGPDTMEKYKLKTRDFYFTVSLEPLQE